MFCHDRASLIATVAWSFDDEETEDAILLLAGKEVAGGHRG